MVPVLRPKMCSWRVLSSLFFAHCSYVIIFALLYVVDNET
jgi:hypothetical protein